MENSLSKSFKKSISEEAVSLAKDYSELAFDSVIDNEALKHIPILGTLISLYKVGCSLREAHTIKKILVFIGQLSDVSEDERIDFLTSLDDDDKYKESIFEKVLLVIERLDETEKAEIIGNLFRLYVMTVLTNERFLRLSNIVEKAAVHDLHVLHHEHRTYEIDREPNCNYYWNKETEAALYNLGVLSLTIDTKNAEYRANYFKDKGAITPDLGFKVNTLGVQLANLMWYDLDNMQFKALLDKMKTEIIY